MTEFSYQTLQSTQIHEPRSIDEDHEDTYTEHLKPRGNDMSFIHLEDVEAKLEGHMPGSLAAKKRSDNIFQGGVIRQAGYWSSLSTRDYFRLATAGLDEKRSWTVIQNGQVHGAKVSIIPIEKRLCLHEADLKHHVKSDMSIQYYSKYCWRSVEYSHRYSAQADLLTKTLKHHSDRTMRLIRNTIRRLAHPKNEVTTNEYPLKTGRC